jgi:hypothetical protein
MPKLEFKFKSEDKRNRAFTGPSRGWIVCYPQRSHDGKDLELSPDCITAAEIRTHAKLLKEQLDRIVEKAERKFRETAMD